MDDSAPTHERRKLVKTYKNVLPQKQTVAAEVCGRDLLRMNSKKMEQENGHGRKNNPHIKGER